ncbi:1-(5-phosphoribosyl)-5-[(5-phosphoribosylamino)methylideneamino]imidazole-4-carboxamide isomerase [Elusimicrobiota bacterium]
MQIIPAIDLRGGNCVRLTQGKLSKETLFSKEPLIVAKLWQAQGAKRLHVVDLDGAFSGKMKNGNIIKKIIKELDIPVQIGGGIRDYDTIRSLIKAGASRVILGTAAIYDEKLLKTAIKKWTDRIIIGIDSSAGKVAIGGWKNITTKWATTLALEMERIGIKEIIITDIKKDGTLEGPNYKWIQKIANKVSIDVIASGGVSGLDDVMKLKELGLKNLSGIIVGKALYKDQFNLAEAVRAVV